MSCTYVECETCGSRRRLGSYCELCEERLSLLSDLETVVGRLRALGLEVRGITAHSARAPDAETIHAPSVRIEEER